MRAFWLLLRLRALESLRTRSSTIFFFLVPLLLLVLTSTIFYKGHPFEQRTVAIVESALTRDVSQRLAPMPEVNTQSLPSETTARAWLDTHTVDAVITTRNDRVMVLSGPKGTLLARGLVSVLPNAQLEIVQIPRWGYAHYLFPGLLAFTVLISGVFGMGHPMLRYRESGFLKKLSLTPLRKSTFVAAQIAARTALVLGQIALLVLAAVLLMGLPLSFASALWLLFLTTVGLVTFLGIGLFVAAIVPTSDVLVDAVSAVTTPLVLLSEMFFPVAELPAPLPTIASLLPTTQLVRLGRMALLEHQMRWEVAGPGLLILLAWAVGSFVLGVRAFRWNS